MSSDYRLAAPLAVRILGALVAGVGLLVVAVAVLTSVLDWPDPVGLVAVAVGAGVLGAAYVVVRRRVVVRLGETGYRVRLIRGAGITSARWTEVDDVDAAEVGGARCVVLRLRDGRTTTIPVTALAGSGAAFVDELRRRLDAGHRYRHLG